MQAIKRLAKVNTQGEVVVSGLDLKHGMTVEVIVLLPDKEELADLVSASESSLGFWDNPIDDEVWNDA